MAASPIQTICVCGAGTMGSGIAQLSAQSGFHTLLYDLDPQRLGLAAAGLRSRLQELQTKKRISEEEREATLGRLEFTSDPNHCIADLVIEAIIESLSAKTALLNQLAEINHGEVIFASNTSSLSVTALADSVQGPERVLGMHFFNPAPLMKLVEIVYTPYCRPEYLDCLLAVAQKMGKTAVTCRDSPGFIVNRVARPYYLEALKILEAGIAPIPALDALLESAGFRMGPFRLMDLIGNDINYAVSESLYEALGKPERLRPSARQRELVAKGALGKKTGQGYYPYP